MATIALSFPFSLPAKDVKKILQQLGDQLGAEYSANIQWHGDALSFKRSGVDGVITIGKHALDVKIQLGMMASLLKGRIETEIRDYCSAHLR